jgi:3D (Asp-Asp-Asp) domain-containing protein
VHIVGFRKRNKSRRKIVFLLALILCCAVALRYHVVSINTTAAVTALNHATVIDGDDIHEFLTPSGTVDDLLKIAGIRLQGFDRISHPIDTPVSEDLTVIVEREINFFVSINENPVIRRAGWHGFTVADAMELMGNELGQSYLPDVNMNRLVRNGETLNFTTVRIVTEIETFDIDYESVTNHSRNLWNGRRIVRQEGESGIFTIATEIVYVGGVEVDRRVISEEITVHPVDEIVDVGRARLGALADSSAPDFHYSRRLVMEATAYTAGFSCTGKHPDDPLYRITASGREVEHGIVAVDRNVIPLGTRLYVQGYGFAIAADVGGAIRGYAIDLFMEDIDDAIRFGRQFIHVWILDDISG